MRRNRPGAAPYRLPVTERAYPGIVVRVGGRARRERLLHNTTMPLWMGLSSLEMYCIFMNTSSDRLPWEPSKGRATPHPFSSNLGTFEGY